MTRALVLALAALGLAACNGTSNGAATPSPSGLAGASSSRAQPSHGGSAESAPSAGAAPRSSAAASVSAAASTAGSASAALHSHAAPPPDPELEREIADTLGVLSRARGLPFTRKVPGRRLNRDQVIARISAKVEKDTPPAALQGQGELLGALELIPPDYDFVAGVYALIRSNLAGFYDPDDHGEMFLLDDLNDGETHETLVHELVHALQDQNFGLESRLKYVRGASDRTAAVHAVGEGEATSATFDVSMGSAFNMSPADFRRDIHDAVKHSTAGSAPAILAASLAAPYADGYDFIQQARKKGGWKAVDAIWQRLPSSTEQLLHFDKYEANEPPLDVPVPSFATLGPGFSALDDDVVGEQTLRIALEQWTTASAAAAAAAGWAGDHYVVAQRNGSPPTYRAPPGELAVAWMLRFDTPRDATELGAVLGQKLGSSCRERPLHGAIAWARRDTAVAIVVGPYERDAGGARVPHAESGCGALMTWLKSLLVVGP